MSIILEKENHTLFIQHYHANQTIDNAKEYRIVIRLYQKFYKVKIELSQTSIENHLLIKDCNFTSSSSHYFNDRISLLLSVTAKFIIITMQQFTNICIPLLCSHTYSAIPLLM